MEAVRESAEHHYLRVLETIKADPGGWMVLHFALSKMLQHSDIIKKPDEIQEKITKGRIRADAFLEQLNREASEIEEGYAYMFADHDVLLLARIESEKEKKLLKDVYSKMVKELPEDLSKTGVLSSDLFSYQKFSDQKFLSAKRFEAYSSMSDENKVSSIPLRRQRRDHSKVMIVEDDRFTASYTANILSKDYDLIICRNGEEGIEAYIDQAPDIVFLDIHLPGLSGHDTLEAIKAVDPKAFVVMLSVDTARTNIMQASEGGARNFLKKPFSKERLINTVKNSPYVRGLPVDDSVH